MRKNQLKNCYKHGFSRLKEYKVWGGMIDRCENPKNPSYKNYGERGITVCGRWRNSFVLFYEDMGPRPSVKHSLDRIDNNGSYYPDNCRWATQTEQCNNTRYNVRITIKGRTETLSDWCRILNLNYGRVKMRLVRGWGKERALELNS